MRASPAIPVILLLASSPAPATAPAPPPAAPAGLAAPAGAPAARIILLVDVAGQVDVRPAAGGPGEEALVGRLLRPGDVVDVGSGVAWVYGSDGSLVTVGTGERWTVPLAGDGAPRAGLPDEARARIAYGLRRWSLGLEAPSPLAPEAGRRASPDGSIRLLSPSSEPVLDAHPDFFWTGTREPVRVVVARGGKILYRSGPVTGSFLRYPSTSRTLRPEVEHEWWLESISGARIGAKARFKVARPALQAEVQQFEEAVSLLATDTGRETIPDVLRCAYYSSIGMWSRVLEASYDLPTRRGTRRFSETIGSATRRRLHLDPWASTYLVSLRVWRRLDI